jgi:hypothetical protein
MFRFTFSFSAKSLGLEGACLTAWLDAHRAIAERTETAVEATAAEFGLSGYDVSPTGCVTERYDTYRQNALTQAVAECVRTTGVVEPVYNSCLLIRANAIRGAAIAAEAAQRETTRAKLIARALAMPVSNFVSPAYYNAKFHEAYVRWPDSLQSEWSFGRSMPDAWDWDDPRVTARRAEIAAAISTSNAEATRNYEQEQAQAARAAAAELAERKAWAAAHGSGRLQRCLAEGVACGGLYRDERLSVERPGWLWNNNDLPGKYGDPVNPSEVAFTLLDEARKSSPDATLGYYTHPADEDDPDSDETCEYCAVSEFMGREIVYFAQH